MTNIAMDNTGVLQCMNWPTYKLFDFSSKENSGSFTTRMKIERFLFVTDLKQLQETVHFDLKWGDGTTSDTQKYEGKSIEVSLNIYDTQQ